MNKLIKKDHYNIHVVESEGFKNYKLEVNFLNTFDRSKIALRECVFRMLYMGNKLYKTSVDISIKTEELYDCISYFNKTRLGEVVKYSVFNKFLDPIFVKDDNYIEENIKYLFDLIFNAEFNQNNLDFVKSDMIDEIKSIEEDPRDYSYYKANEVLDKFDYSAISFNGSIDDVEAITLEALEKEYKNILNESKIEISLLCKSYDDSFESLIDKYALFTNNSNEVLVPYRSIKYGTNKLIEEKDFSQSSITVIYNIDELTNKERDYVLNIFEDILGGGGLDTRLNQNLREKNSLCYGVYASYSKFDRRLMIETLVSKENIDEALDLIIKTVDTMDKVTSIEIDKKIKTIKRFYEQRKNNLNELLTRNLYIDLGYMDEDDIALNTYDSITTEEVESIKNKLHLNTIYILKGVK